MAENQNIKLPSSLSFFKNIDKDIYYYDYIIFKSIYDFLTLVYADENNSLIFYDLVSFKKINQINNSVYQITDLRYHLDNKNKRDLIMITGYENIIQIWDYNKLECLTKIEIKDENGCHILSCFIYFNNSLNIIATLKYSDNNPFLIYDIEGNKLEEIKNSYKYINKLNSYYNNKLSSTYVIVKMNNINSFYLNEKKEYFVYENQFKFNFIKDVIIDDNEETIKLIGHSNKNIQIWNFNTGENIINLEFQEDLYDIYCINTWNPPFYFISTYNREENGSTKIKFVDIRNGKVIQNLDYKNDNLKYIIKINHPSIGDALLVLTSTNKIELLLPNDK